MLRYIRSSSAEINIQPSKTRELQNKAVIGAIYATFVKNEAEARRFWGEVARGGDPDQQDSPEWVLDDWLRAPSERKVKRPSLKSLYQGCIYAWNAWRENKRITTIRFDVKKNFLTVHE